MPDDNLEGRGFLQALVADGRPLVSLTGLILILAGAFSLFQSATGHFLPHDVQYLGMTSQQLCELHQCRIVHFMFHDRVSFGGAIIAVGSLYLWIAEFPLRLRRPWSWWLLLLSGVLGFGSFLTYLGYGYLDSWHGVATLVLLPIFLWGLIRSFGTLPRPARARSLIQRSTWSPLLTALGLGRACLLLTAGMLIVGGLTIMTIGMTSVFVPQDLQFMGVSSADLHGINPRLVPLIAHDRAGFGGGLCCTGVLVFFCVWCAAPTRGLWQVLCIAGTAGFATAIGIHPTIGYTSVTHLAPAVVAALFFVLGLILCFKPMMRFDQSDIDRPDDSKSASV